MRANGTRSRGKGSWGKAGWGRDSTEGGEADRVTGGGRGKGAELDERGVHEDEDDDDADEVDGDEWDDDADDDYSCPSMASGW